MCSLEPQYYGPWPLVGKTWRKRQPTSLPKASGHPRRVGNLQHDRVNEFETEGHATAATRLVPDQNSRDPAICHASTRIQGRTKTKTPTVITHQPRVRRRPDNHYS